MGKSVLGVMMVFLKSIGISSIVKYDKIKHAFVPIKRDKGVK
jgi:hypothetical protein